MSETIDSFKGEHRWLSNFWPVELPWGYSSVEHAYQAAKTPDHKLKEWIRNARDAHDAKKRGNHPKVGATMPEDWDEQKADIMYVLLRQKFFHLDLRQKLLATYPAILIEGNTWGDTFWGVCRGEGQNMLGKILMRVRGEYLFATICEVCKKRLACFDWAIHAGSCPGLLVCEPCAMCEESEESHEDS